MVDKILMEVPLLSDHVAVRLQHYVLAFSGMTMMDNKNHFIWSYNLYTEHWRKYRIPSSKSAPFALDGASAVAIGTDVYMFGGDLSNGPANGLWRLTINKNSHFTWTKMSQKAISETPSGRREHSAWEYNGKMWVFGGYGIFSAGFLNAHGDFTGYLNNQLLCYHPGSNTWTNPKCFGDVPSPRKRHATAIIRNTVFLYGGSQMNSLGDFFMMNMASLFWTMIKTNRRNPGRRSALTLTAVTASQLVLHGGYTEEKILHDVDFQCWETCVEAIHTIQTSNPMRSHRHKRSH